MVSNDKFGDAWERELARKYDVKLVPNSGSGRRKGDGQIGNFLIDAKATRSKEYIIRKKDVENISCLADRIGRTGVLCLNISGLELLVLPLGYLPWIAEKETEDEH